MLVLVVLPLMSSILMKVLGGRICFGRYLG